MNEWDAILTIALLGGIVGALLTISKQVDRLINQIVALRAELRLANGQETTSDFVAKLSALGLTNPKSR